MNIAAEANIDIDQLDNTEEMEPMKSNTKKSTKKPYENKIIIHYTHEKRFQPFKRDMHKIYEDTFKNSPAMAVKIIVGNRNRPDAKHELVRKRPKQAILQNKTIESKYLKIIESRTSFFFLLCSYIERQRRSKKISTSTKRSTKTSTVKQ
jgi:hypothetical protein